MYIYICKVYVLGLRKGVSAQTMALYGTKVPPFQDPEIAIEWMLALFLNTSIWCSNVKIDPIFLYYGCVIRFHMGILNKNIQVIGPLKYTEIV